VQDPSQQAIMPWVPLIKKVLTAGKSIIVDLQHREVEDFIAAMDSPQGIYLWINSNDEEEQRAIIKRLEKWR
jgi:nucleoside-triphosphatase THEP1